MLLDLVIGTLLALLGVFSGFLGSLLGVGGGIIVVPMLIIFFNLETRLAVGTSLVMIIFTALSSTLAYLRQNRIDWKIGVIAATSTVPGAALGAYLTKFFASREISIIFAITLFMLSGWMIRRSFHKTDTQKRKTTKNVNQQSRGIWKRKIVDSAGNVFEYNAKILSGLILLIVGGLASGFLGIGGGLIVVPILATVVGLPMHVAVATSMVTMIFTSISGVSTHIMLGNVKIDYAIPLVIGILIGAQLGPRTAKQLKSASLERVFATFVLAMGLLLLISRI